MSNFDVLSFMVSLLHTIDDVLVIFLIGLTKYPEKLFKRFILAHGFRGPQADMSDVCVRGQQCALSDLHHRGQGVRSHWNECLDSHSLQRAASNGLLPSHRSYLLWLLHRF